MKNKGIVFLLVFVFTSFYSSGYFFDRQPSFLGAFSAYAEEDDDDEDEREDDESEDSSSPSTETVRVIETIVIEPARTVTENVLRDEILADSDKDGLPDSEDPHPSIPEIYIVSDNNNNGIVDTLEYAR